MDPRIPRIGDDVHFVLHFGPNRGSCRPAKVVRLWTPYADCVSTGCVQLTVFTDWTNDLAPGQPGADGLVWATSVQQAIPVESVTKPYSFHYDADCPS